jgi:hypothetical protein
MVTRDPADSVQFIVQVFNATGDYCSERPTVLSIMPSNRAGSGYQSSIQRASDNFGV